MEIKHFICIALDKSPELSGLAFHNLSVRIRAYKSSCSGGALPRSENTVVSTCFALALGLFKSN